MKKVLVLILLGLGLAWVITYDHTTKSVNKSASNKVIPVKIAEIQHGSIELIREFTGTLEANSQFIVSPRISGRIKKLQVDLADMVKSGQVVVELDDAEYIQSVIQAQANLEIAKADLIEAENLFIISQRKLRRIEKIQKRGLSSESQYDAIKSEQLTQQAQVAITKAKLTQAEAILKISQIQLSYTKITVDWTGGNLSVAERYVDVGANISANTPLLRMVELNPITAVFFATERDYALLQPKQLVAITTDVYPAITFHGNIERIAPVFNQNTHQARIELRIVNPKLRLKPGMFVHITIVLEKIANATIIPTAALTTRNEKSGVFLLAADEKSVLWHEVQTGIKQAERVQIIGEKITGKVVILGQQLLDNGSNITLFK